MEEVNLPEARTTVELVAVLQRARKRADGIQLLWPLPPCVDAAAWYAEVPLRLDVGGCWLEQLGLAGRGL